MPDLTPQQPPQRGPVTPHGPHSPSGAPEGPATRGRAADGRTTPTAWIDGDPLMEAIAAAIWKHCRPEGTSLVVDDPRNIAAVAAHAIRTAPDSRTDSPDRTPDTITLTSADTVRTTPDTPPMDPVRILGIGAPAADEDAPDDALREQYAAAVNHALLPTTPGRDRRQVMAEHAAAAVLAVRDRRMVQLAAEVEQHVTANLEAAARAQQVIEEQRATIARVRALATELENEKTDGPAFSYQGGRVDGAYEAAVRIRAALDTPPAEQAPPATYAEAQQRHIQVLRRRRAARQAMDDAWDRIEEAAIRDLVRLATKEH